MANKYGQLRNHIKRDEFDEAYDLLVANPDLLKRVVKNNPIPKFFQEFYYGLTRSSILGDEQDREKVSNLVEMAKEAGASKSVIVRMKEMPVRMLFGYQLV